MSVWTVSRSDASRQAARLIADLLGSRPASDAEVGDRARWMGRRADVFTQVAQLHEAQGDLVRAGEARAQAAEATLRARALTEEATAELRAGGAAEPAARRETLRERAARQVEPQAWLQARPSTAGAQPADRTTGAGLDALVDVADAHDTDAHDADDEDADAWEACL